MDETYRTLASASRLEIDKIQGSRFIGTAWPLADPSALEPRLAALRAEFPDANHHVWAWRIGERFRYGDDGEPSGTGGRPLLRAIDGRGLDGVAVVVSRIFGGTKLGTGGLTRAYARAAAAALEAATIRTIVRTRRVRIRHDYAETAAVQALLAAWDLEPAASRFEADVRLTLDLPASAAERFVAELRERTAGRAEAGIEDGDAARDGNRERDDERRP